MNEKSYPVYEHPFVDTVIAFALKLLQTVLYVCGTLMIANHYGWLVSLAFLVVYFTIRAMDKETIYAHSDLGLGPGRLVIFQENLATGMRYAALVNVLAWATREVVRIFAN